MRRRLSTAGAPSGGGARAWLAIAAVVFSGTVTAATLLTQDPPAKERSPAEEDAWATATEALATETCGGCHPMADITQTRHTWQDWNDVVVRMAALGLSASDDQLTEIKLYLTRYYGLVNVNTASAGEIAAVLGLSHKQAAAVVEYRHTHGRFANAAALAEAAGVDRSKLDEQAGAIRFN